VTTATAASAAAVAPPPPSLLQPSVAVLCGHRHAACVPGGTALAANAAPLLLLMIHRCSS
jgi:hypothetical protein